MLDELKQRELGNHDKEEKMQVKKKTIDLLPDADNNLLKLQVGGVMSNCWLETRRQTQQDAHTYWKYVFVSSSRLWWRPAPSGW